MMMMMMMMTMVMMMMMMIMMMTCVDCRTPEKDWKTNKHMGCANTNVLPMAKFGRMEGHRNADRILADTYGLFY